MFHNLSRANLRKRGFVIRAALWETTFWSCSNCGHYEWPLARVRVMNQPKPSPKRRPSAPAALKRLLRAQAAVDKVTDYSRFGGSATMELLLATENALRALGK